MIVKSVDNYIQVKNIDTKGRYFCLSIARMVTRTRHSVTLLYIAYLVIDYCRLLRLIIIPYALQ